MRSQTRSSRNGSADGQPPASARDVDLLYTIARDPKTLFVYWDVNWTRLFEQAALSPRQVHLRIYRRDGSVEGTREINPFLEHCYLEVSSAGADYYCELGCFEGDDWTNLVRSGMAATPEDRLSDDLSARFATLPLHLSFQRMLNTFRASESTPATLAQRIGERQEKGMAAPNGKEGTRSSDLKTLLEAALRDPTRLQPSAEQLAQWQRLTEQFGGSSWGGASESGSGGSSSA